MNYLILLCCIFYYYSAVGMVNAEDEKPAAPNIVFILADDLVNILF